MTRSDRRHAHSHPQRGSRAPRRARRCRYPVKVRIAEILKVEGFIDGVRGARTTATGTLTIVLKYGRDRCERHRRPQARLRPGRRVYVRHDRTCRKVMSGMGISIISTSRGVLTDRAGRRKSASAASSCARFGDEYRHDEPSSQRGRRSRASASVRLRCRRASRSRSTAARSRSRARRARSSASCRRGVDVKVDGKVVHVLPAAAAVATAAASRA